MNRAAAIALAQKLQTLAERGATAGERAAAQHKLDRHLNRYGLKLSDWSAPPKPSPANGAGAPSGTPSGFRAPRWYAPRRGPAQAAWSFDVSTGEASPNVTVHRYQDRANWKIEVPVEAVFGDPGPRRRRSKPKRIPGQ